MDRLSGPDLLRLNPPCRSSVPILRAVSKLFTGVVDTIQQTSFEAFSHLAGVLRAELSTTEAVASDLAGMKAALDAQQQVGLEPPSHLYADSAYVNGAELAQASEEGRQLIGPVKGSPKKKGMFPVESFDISIEERRAVCPAGHKSQTCCRIADYHPGETMFRFRWGTQCRDCPLQAQCTGKRESRMVVVSPNHDFLQRRRREMGTEAFERQAKNRAAIEGTISELIRGYGLRKTRYRGLAKTRLANYFIAAACNIRRWGHQIAWRAEIAEANAA